MEQITATVVVQNLLYNLLASISPDNLRRAYPHLGLRNTPALDYKLPLLVTEVANLAAKPPIKIDLGRLNFTANTPKTIRHRESFTLTFQ